MTDTIQLAYPDRLYIGGKWVEPETSAKLTLINPASEQPFLEVAEAAAGDVEKAVAAARRAFDVGPWPRKSAAERAALMRALGKALDKRGATIESAWTSQVGVPATMAKGSSLGASAILDLYDPGLVKIALNGSFC